MVTRLEILKDSVEESVTSGVARVGNIHGLISGYARQVLRGERDRHTIYDVIGGVTREVGGFGTDLFEIVETGRRADRDRQGDETVDDA